MAVLCYSQLVTSAHFVEHLPHAGHTEHAAEHGNFHAAEHAPKIPTRLSSQLTKQFAKHHNDAFHRTGRTHGRASENSERSFADCSIYHVFSNLNGVVQAKANIPCALFNHVTTANSTAVTLQKTAALHQPIRAPPHFS